MDRGEGAGEQADARAVRRDGQGARASRRSRSRSRAASRRRSRKSGRCSRASSSARASGRSGCSSIRAFAPAGISSSCAAGAASSKASRSSSPTGGTASPTRRPTAREAMLRPTKARRNAARSRSRGAQAPRRRRDAPPAPNPDTRAGVSVDARLRRARQQPRPPAAPARARARARSHGCRERASSRSSPQLRERARRHATSRSPTTSTRWPRSTPSLAPRALLAALQRDRAPAAAAARARAAQRAAHARPRSAAVRRRRRIARPELTAPASAHARTRVRAACRCSRSRRGARSPAAASRGAILPRVRGQRIARTRTARLRASIRPTRVLTRPMDLEKCRYIVVEGPIGAGKTSLARAARAARRRRGAARAPRGQSVPRALLRGHARASRCRRSSHFLFQRVDQLRGVGQLDMFRPRDRRRFPARQGSAVRAAQPVRRRVSRSTRRSTRT